LFYVFFSIKVGDSTNVGLAKIINATKDIMYKGKLTFQVLCKNTEYVI